MGKTGRAVRLALLFSALLFAAHARAADPAPETPDASPQARQEAKERYEQGAAAYEAGRFKDAVDLFREADRLAPSAPLSFNIARAYEKLGDDAGALRWYRDYLRRAPAAPNVKDVRSLVQEYERRLAKKGVQQLTVMSTPAGATVSVDERPVGVTPWTGELPPGPHRVDLSMRGFEDAVLDVRLAPDRAQDVSARLAPAQAEPAPAASPSAPPASPLPPSAPPPAPGAPRDEPSGGLGIWPWVTLGAGGAALGGALAFELLRRSSESDAESDQTQVGYQEKLDQMESRQTAARVLAGVGGALVIAGGVLVILDLGSGNEGEQASLLVVPDRGGGFAFASGSF